MLRKLSIVTAIAAATAGCQIQLDGNQVVVTTPQPSATVTPTVSNTVTPVVTTVITPTTTATPTATPTPSVTTTPSVTPTPCFMPTMPPVARSNITLTGADWREYSASYEQIFGDFGTAHSIEISSIDGLTLNQSEDGVSYTATGWQPSFTASLYKIFTGETCSGAPKPYLAQEVKVQVALLGEPTQPPTPTPVVTPVPSEPPTTERFPVIAYQPSWAFDLNAIQWDKLTHINYSFALPDADGSLTIEQPQNLQALSNAAVGKDTEIWLAIGGWTIGDGGGNDADWSTITSNPQLLERFKGEIQAAIDTYNLDGIDIDWEWPNNNTEKALYLQLMQELDAMLEPQGKGLSTAVVSRGANGQYVDSQVFELVDYFNLMAYDDNWPWSGDNKHSDMGVAEASIAYWVDQRGVPAEKAVLGVPFYCRGNGNAISYEQLLASGADPASDAHQGCYYNGTETMKAKAQLAVDRTGGIMFWELSQDVEDERSLLTAIHNVVSGVAAPTPAPTPAPGECAAPAFEAGKVYTSGDQVSFNGGLYQAQWWINTGDPTGEAWIRVGRC